MAIAPYIWTIRSPGGQAIGRSENLGLYGNEFKTLTAASDDKKNGSRQVSYDLKVSNQKAVLLVSARDKFREGGMQAFMTIG